MKDMKNMTVTEMSQWLIDKADLHLSTKGAQDLAVKLLSRFNITTWILPSESAAQEAEWDRLGVVYK